ncbi:MAG: hypothetical protein BGO67_07750 [Alphaproteobacteria bacterium 41-28]|nr:MAG: hypothetical protein BGO67_07750 [Alphaproteobacteria bacterium 41-28]
MTIEIMKIFKESFRDAREHKLEWARVACAPVVIWLIGIIFMSLVYWSVGLWSFDALVSQMKGESSSFEQPFIATFAHVVYYITYFIAIFNLYINGFRYGVLGEGGDRWWALHLDWRFVKMILYSILIGILATIYILITGGIALGAHFLVGSTALTVVLGILFVIYGIYLALRLSLTYLLIAIDQEKPIRVSWRLLKGNVLRVLGLLILIGIVISLIGLAGIIVLGILGWILSLISVWLIAIPIVLFALFSIILWFVSWIVGTKALSLVYKTFTSGTAF